MNRRESAVTLRESKRKILKLELLRRRRNEINYLINKEIRIRNGAQNLLIACKNNREIEEKLRLEITFMDSKVEYLKDQLAQLSCDWSVFKNTKHENASKFLEQHYYTINNDLNTVKSYQDKNISPDIMIYLALKETVNKLNAEVGFKQFIKQHYQDEPNNFTDQIKQFNYFRESTIRLSYEPDMDSVKRLFEYYCSLIVVEKRFFNLQSQCNYIYFTWYDCINGIQSTQKSIQYEKASVLFNCAALYSQIAAIRQNGKENLLNEQKLHWQLAAGCLKYLNVNFSNSPSLDMSNQVLDLFIETFISQAYESLAKSFIKESKIKQFSNFISVSKIYAHIAERYTKISNKVNQNESIKKYLPEIWFYLIKVKSLHFKSLSHYFAAMAINSNDIDTNYSENELVELFNSLHDMSKFKSKIDDKSYDEFYNYSILKAKLNVKLNLVKAHLRESIVFQEEAVRQHSFCRKFSRNDYLHDLLRYYHDIALEKFLELENEYFDFDNELFEVLPIKSKLDSKLILTPIDPNFEQYESKDFFNLIGPIKIYSSFNTISSPYTCILKKSSNQLTYGITVKGDSPVKINSVDPKSSAYNAGIREGDFIIAIQDQDVRWSKHNEVVEKIRSCVTYVKLTLVNVERIDSDNKIVKTAAPTPTLSKSSCSSVQTSFKIKKNLNDGNKKLNEEVDNEKHFKSTRFPFSTLQFGRKFKRNNFKLNIFSSLKTKTTLKIDVDNKSDQKVLKIPNEEKLLMRQNEIMYKTL